MWRMPGIISACSIGFVCIDMHFEAHIRRNADGDVIENQSTFIAINGDRDFITMGNSQNQSIERRHMDMPLGNDHPGC